MLKFLNILAGPLVGFLIFAILHYGSGVATGPSLVALLCIWMALWWMTEAVPMELTSLLPMIYLPFTGIYAADAMQQSCLPYSDKTVYFFLGGFALGIAIEKTALHRRGALFLLRLAGTNATIVVGAFMLATAALSMWVNNTATTVLMLPLAMSVLATQSNQRFATSLLLGVAYASSIGGMATLVGTAPNVFFAGFMQRENMEIGFLPWMGIALPIAAILLFGCWVWMTCILWPMKGLKIDIPTAWQDEIAAAPRLNGDQKWTLFVFMCAAALWMLREPVLHLSKTPNVPSAIGSAFSWLAVIDDSWVAMATLVAFMFTPLMRPILAWKDIEQIPWGVLLLFGGGLSLSKAIKESKLDAVIASASAQLGGLPPWFVIVMVVIAVIAVSELASNLATATTLLPILASVGPALGVDQVSLLCATVLASSCGFMLPVATPPNTLVFAQKRFPVRDMLLAGLGLNVMSVITISIIVIWLKPLVLGP